MTRSRCAATAPGFLIFAVLNCAESMKRLRRKCFAFGRLITPTLFLYVYASPKIKPLHGFVFRGELQFQLYNAFTKYLLQKIRHSLCRLNRGNHQEFRIHISKVDIISGVADQLS